MKTNAQKLQWLAIIKPAKPCIVCHGIDEGNTCCPPDFTDEEPTKPMPAATMAALVNATTN